MRIITWLLSIYALIGVCCGAKILAVVPTPTKSHHYILEKLALDLVARGHEVTLITAFPQKKPLKNLEEIIFPNYYDELLKRIIGTAQDKINDISSIKRNFLFNVLTISKMGVVMSEEFLSNPVIQKFLKLERRYDVILGDAFSIEGILAGFVKKYNAPLIAVATGPASYFSNYMVGNPSPTAFVPFIHLNYDENMTFFERLINFVAGTLAEIYTSVIVMPQQDVLMRKYFGHDLPYVKRIMENTSLVLVNHHHSLAFPRPYVPNMIEIGGFHVKPAQPLPKEIQQYMDGAKDGVILLSMGSHFKSSLMPKKAVEAILNTFSRLKENVIWKFDATDLPGLPKNVKIMKWVPQSDILAHPNLKLFITHGGMLSITEAIFRGVPLVGVPVFGDQPSNAKFIERKGYGKTLPLLDLTENHLYDTIMEVLQNPVYKNNVKRGSKVLQDTPLTASETAMYWIEYVIRHKGAPHLRSAAQDLEWYQLYLLDLLAVFFIVSFLFLWFWYKIVSFVWKKLCGGKSNNVSQKKKKN